MWNNKAVLGNSEIVTLSQNQTGTLLFAILRSDLGGDAADEALDVELRGAGLLAGRVGALEAAASLPQGGPLAQRRVLYVVKVLEEGRARTEESGFTFHHLKSREETEPFHGDKSDEDKFLFVLTRSY